MVQSTNSKGCSMLKEGTFKYLDIEDTTAYFVISAANHTEFFSNGAYTIKSKITWIDSCSYKMTMQSNTLPHFPFKPGQTMTVIIDKIEDGLIYYIARVEDKQWKGRLVKLK